jgi:hypothetical protein
MGSESDTYALIWMYRRLGGRQCELNVSIDMGMEVRGRFARCLLVPATGSPDHGQKSQRRKERDGAFSTLNLAIDTCNLAKDVSGGFAPGQAAFGCVSVLLASYD